MIKTVVNEFETFLADKDVGANNRSTDEVKSGLLFLASVLGVLLTGVFLMLKAS